MEVSSTPIKSEDAMEISSVFGGASERRCASNLRFGALANVTLFGISTLQRFYNCIESSSRALLQPCKPDVDHVIDVKVQAAAIADSHSSCVVIAYVFHFMLFSFI